MHEVRNNISDVDGGWWVMMCLKSLSSIPIASFSFLCLYTFLKSQTQKIKAKIKNEMIINEPLALGFSDEESKCLQPHITKTHFEKKNSFSNKVVILIKNCYWYFKSLIVCFKIFISRKKKISIKVFWSANKSSSLLVIFFFLNFIGIKL